MALTLKFMNDQREAKWHAGELVVAEGDRAFKPSLMFVPAATLDQTFNELSTLWNGVLDVYSLYQSKLNCTNPTRQSVTIDTTQELQEMVDAWAAKADDPATGRVLVITSYTTGISRMSKPDKAQPLTKEQMNQIMNMKDITKDVEEFLIARRAPTTTATSHRPPRPARATA